MGGCDRLRGYRTVGILRNNHRDVDGADPLGDAIEHANAEGDEAWGKVELLEELEGCTDEISVLGCGERERHGLAAAIDQLAVGVVGGDVEFHRAVVSSGVGAGERDLAGRYGEEKAVAREWLVLEFGVERPEDARVGGIGRLGAGLGLYIG